MPWVATYLIRLIMSLFIYFSTWWGKQVKLQCIFGGHNWLFGHRPFLLSECTHRCDFSPRGSPYCSINGTKATPWFFALALSVDWSKRFVISKKEQLQLTCGFMNRGMAILPFLTVVKWAGGVRMILSRNLAIVPVRSYGIYCIKAKVEWSAGDKGRWLATEG